VLKTYTALSLVIALDWAAQGCSPSSGRILQQTDNANSAGAPATNGGAGGTSSVQPQSDAGYIVTTTGGSGGAAGDTSCGRSQFPVQQRPADVLLVLDRSASMTENSTPTKWAIVTPSLVDVVNATANSLWWGLKVFPVGNDSQCTQGTYPSGEVVEIAANNAAAMVAGINGVQPTGNGTPTSDAINEASKYLQTLQDGNPKFILLATDGEPSCNGMTGSVDTAGAKTAAISAISTAAKAGFHTFVVGVQTAKESASDTLNQMAVAGQEWVPNPNPIATRYYMATTADQLVNAFNSITAVVKTCLFPLTQTPPDPAHVNVFIDSGGNATQIIFDPANGWSFTGSDMLTIQLSGTACAQVTSSGAGAVRVIFGCKNDPVIIT
jgi:hypothetical protein